MRAERLAPDAAAAAVEELAAILLDAVADGVSADFLADLAAGEARDWWTAALADPDRTTFVTRDDEGRVVGVVQLRVAHEATGRHRADVLKLLVHRRARGRGAGSALMAALEADALARGRWLLLLDTQTGSFAERLYEHWGWRRIGVLPDHATDPHGTPTASTFFAKDLRSGS
jgi:GNAT superfamily N-acetyltransferase